MHHMSGSLAKDSRPSVASIFYGDGNDKSDDYSDSSEDNINIIIDGNATATSKTDLCHKVQDDSRLSVSYPEPNVKSTKSISTEYKTKTLQNMEEESVIGNCESLNDSKNLKTFVQNKVEDMLAVMKASGYDIKGDNSSVAVHNIFAKFVEDSIVPTYDQHCDKEVKSSKNKKNKSNLCKLDVEYNHKKKKKKEKHKKRHKQSKDKDGENSLRKRHCSSTYGHTDEGCIDDMESREHLNKIDGSKLKEDGKRKGLRDDDFLKRESVSVAEESGYNVDVGKHGISSLSKELCGMDGCNKSNELSGISINSTDKVTNQLKDQKCLPNSPNTSIEELEIKEAADGDKDDSRLNNLIEDGYNLLKKNYENSKSLSNADGCDCLSDLKYFSNKLINGVCDTEGNMTSHYSMKRKITTNPHTLETACKELPSELCCVEPCNVGRRVVLQQRKPCDSNEVIMTWKERARIKEKHMHEKESTSSEAAARQSSEERESLKTSSCSQLKIDLSEEENRSCSQLEDASLKGENRSCPQLEDTSLKEENRFCPQLEDASIKEENISCSQLKDASLKEEDRSCPQLKDASLKEEDRSCPQLKDASLKEENKSCPQLKDAPLKEENKSCPQKDASSEKSKKVVKEITPESDHYPVTKANFEKSVVISKERKLAVNLNIKLTDRSISIISSGKKFDEPSKEIEEEIEEGQICDSPKLGKKQLRQHVSSGDSESDTPSPSRDSKKRKKKASRKHKKHKLHKKSSKSPEQHRRRHSSHYGQRSYSRSRSRSRCRLHLRSRSRSRLRLRSKSRSRLRMRSRSRSRSYTRSRMRSDDRKERQRFRRSRSRDGDQSRSSESRRDLRLRIDKSKLRRIAIQQALENARQGGPPVELKPEEVAFFRAGGSNLTELTDYCSQLRDGPDTLETIDPSPCSGGTRPFRSSEPISTSTIVMNIKNARQLPALSAAEKAVQGASLRLQFPVSSGTTHGGSAGQWEQVVKPEKLPEPPDQGTEVDVVEFGLPQAMKIGNMVSERLGAMRRLQDNPYDVQALGQMHKANSTMKSWGNSKTQPPPLGKFTGTTDITPLNSRQLAAAPKYDAWVKKDTLTSTRPVSGGFGEVMLRKMGWNAGEGLGKNKEGQTVPLMLNCKMDRKGLLSQSELRGGGAKLTQPVQQGSFGSTSGAKTCSLDKHPVSELIELCKSRKWPQPEFRLVHESGPAHKKTFIFEVKVNGVSCQPPNGNCTKKTAKADAAAAFLQQL